MEATLFLLNEDKTRQGNRSERVIKDDFCFLLTLSGEAEDGSISKEGKIQTYDSIILEHFALSDAVC